MIVGFQPGGTINSVRVVLRPNETIPNKFNTREAQIFREDPEQGYKWVEIKAVGEVLPPDSELLSEPEVSISSILDLTIPEKCGTIPYEHPDIIRLDGGEDSEIDSDRN